MITVSITVQAMVPTPATIPMRMLATLLLVLLTTRAMEATTTVSTTLDKPTPTLLVHGPATTQRLPPPTAMELQVMEVNNGCIYVSDQDLLVSALG